MFGNMKKPGMLSDTEKDAKMSVLDQIKALCEGQMGDKLKGMKQVTVAGKNPEDIEKGLSLAKNLVGDSDGGELDADDTPATQGDDHAADAIGATPEMLSGAHSSLVDSDHQHMTEDEINQKLEELMALKEKMKAKV